VTSRLLILDTATLYYRAFYALPEKMTSPSGRPHNAVRGFLTMVTKLVSTYRPSGLVAAWDNDWRPEWRVALVPSYKTHRLMPDEPDLAAEDVPDTLSPQITAIAQILDACGIARIGCENYEADDVIASVSHQSSSSNLIVTSDRDLLQVVSDKTSLLLQSTGGIDKWPILGPAEVESRFGVRPDQYLEYAVLRGDPSDGLPGISGIGEKTAAALVQSFETMKNLQAACLSDEISRPLTPRIAQRIIEASDYIDAAMSVVRPEINLPINQLNNAIPTDPYDPFELQELAKAWGVSKYVSALFQAFEG
jgi:5'-3' exonuclease